MGVMKREYWLNYYIFAALEIVAISVFQAAVLCISIAPGFGPYFVLFFFANFCLAPAGLISAVAFRSSSSAVVALIVVLVTSAELFLVLAVTSRIPPWGFYLLGFLIPGFGLSNGLMICMQAAIWKPCNDKASCVGTEVTFKGLRNISIFNGNTYWGVLGVIIANFCIFTLIAHYVLILFPRDGSPAPSWDFIFRRREEEQEEVKRKETDEDCTASSGSDKSLFFTDEEEDSRKTVVEISNVFRRFKRSKNDREEGKYFNAVNDVSMDIKSDQICVLLGHNGAGKTTLIKMMTAQLALNGGSILVDGVDISKNEGLCRQNVGYCPQFDAQFEFMTVREHFEFVASIKGVEDEDEVRGVIEETAEVLSLTPKLDSRVKNLSGGQRRRVSIGMAMIGDPRLLILDEPSTGVDPATRRAMWDCIQKVQQGRAVLITTHFMDECDYLADRVAIMAQGRIVAQGPPARLKQAVVGGYTLTITMPTPDEGEKTRVTGLVMDRILGSRVRNSIALEICINIPSGAVADIDQVLKQLEEEKEGGSIRNLILGVSSIQDVFLSLGHHAESDVGEMKALERDPFSHFFQFRDEGSWLKFTRQTSALYTRRLLAMRHNPQEIIIGTFAPFVVFLFFASIASNFSNTFWQEQVVALDNPFVYDKNFADNYSVSWTLDGVDHDGNLSETFPTDRFVDCMNLKGYELNYFDSKQKLTAGLIREVEESWNSSLKGHPSIFAVAFERYAPRYQEGYDEKNLIDVTLYHNSHVYHYAFPQAYNAVLLCAGGGATAAEETSIFDSVNFDPLYPSKKGNFGATDTVLGQLFGICTAISGIAWSLNLVYDRNANSKHLQFVNGVSPYYYWFGNGIFDLSLYLFSLLVLFIVSVIFGAQHTSSFGVLLVVLISCICFAIVDLPRAYFFTRYFQTASKCLVLNFVFIFVFAILAMILPLLSQHFESCRLADLLFSMFVPSYALAVFLGYAVYKVQTCPFDWRLERTKYDAFCLKQFDMQMFRTVKGNHTLGFTLLMFLSAGLVWWTIFTISEYFDVHPYASFFPKKFSSEKQDDKRNSTSSSDEVGETPSLHFDVDDHMDMGRGMDAVRAERNRIIADFGTEAEPKRIPNPKEEEQDPVLLLRGLRKVYPGHKTTICSKRTKSIAAVDGLYLGINKGSCFGFLGVNGAGKTTTVNILTGIMCPTSGDAYFNGVPIGESQTKMYEQVSYCPQFNGLLENLSARNLFSYYARIALIKEEFIKEFVEEVVVLLGIKEFADRPCGTYSGGNKRKLSVALAFMGNPSVVFLDEPSSGVDPASRRKLWNLIIQTTRSSGRCVILTTHSMEECEALCDCLTIMKGGRMMCFGTPNEVRSELGLGYIVEMFAEVNSSSPIADIEALIEKLSKDYPVLVTQEVNGRRLRWAVPKIQAKLSDLFLYLVNKSVVYGFRDFSIQETSLESIFVQFNESFIANEA